MIGKTVSHYRILEKIGEGGMGEIYLAEDAKLQRKVSLKFIAEELTRDEDRNRRFVQEARAAAAIDHPHIAAIHEIDEADGRMFIAMEYVRGESLREAIRSRKLSLRKFLELAVQVAEGLSKAHERGIVHRDVKPENLLLSEDGYIKIIDFGVAKLLEPLAHQARLSPLSDELETATRVGTRAGMILGTVAYMSPEQARGETVDARSDIFSFGAVLYEMVSGVSPFRRSSAVETLHAIIQDTPAPLDLDGIEIADELRRVLRKALAKDPSVRYQSMKDLAIDLRELGEALVSAERPAVASRRGWRASAGALSLAALSIIALVFLFARREAPPAPGIGVSGRPAIAVLYFENNSGDEEIRWLSKGLPSMLLTDLAQTPGLDVVSSQRIHEILKEVGQETVETIDKSLALEIARRSGAGAVVVGSLFRSGDEIRIDVQVEDVGTGRILSAESVRGSDVFPLVDELTGRIRASLQMTDGPDPLPIRDVTTASLEAYRLYTEGVEARSNLRYPAARSLFEEAVRLDPGFAMAYFELSRVAVGFGDPIQAAEYRQKVFKNLNRLPERDRLLVRARYARSPGGDSDKAAALAEALISRYPDAEDAYILLSTIYSIELLQPERSRALLRRGVEALPNSGPLHNQLGYMLMREGAYEEALAEFEAYARIKPKEPNPFDSMGEIYLVTGRPERALETYARALALDPDFGGSHGGRIWAFSMLGRYEEALEDVKALEALVARIGGPRSRLDFIYAFMLSRLGCYRSAERSLKDGIEETRRREDAGAEAGLHLLAALIALERGSYPEALENVNRALDINHEVNLQAQREGQTIFAQLLAGVAEARQGRIEAARAQLEAQAVVYEPSVAADEWWHRALAGEIALAAGDLEAAEAAFSSGEPETKMWFNNGTPELSVFANNLSFRDGRARVRKARGEFPEAIRIYRELNTPGPNAKWTAMLEPRYVLETARLLEETGDAEGARAEYRRFLELWKDADSGLPEIEEAKAYLVH